MFERDLPGENTAGLSGQAISQLPLEICQTMNGMWGYKVADQNYKSTTELVRLIVRAAAKGSNLLLNIGPQPNGELPAAALERLKGIGQWMKQNGESVYGTHKVADGEQSWGVMTQTEDRLFLHVFAQDSPQVALSWENRKPKVVKTLSSKENLKFTLDRKTSRLTVTLPTRRDTMDCVVEIIR